jgi:hypothetical protein
MLMTKAKTRKTPWDPRPCKLPSCGSQQVAAEVRAYEQLNGGICLQGLYVFDPRACTSEDMRHFFWAGLQLLDSKVKSLGLSEEEVRQLMMASFDTFHDAANGLWDTVRTMMKGGACLPVKAAVEAHCQIISVSGEAGNGRIVYPLALPAAMPISQESVAKPCLDMGLGQADNPDPLQKPEGRDKTLEAEDYPVADFYEPPVFGWNPLGYEARTALKRYSEASNADR